VAAHRLGLLVILRSSDALRTMNGTLRSDMDTPELEHLRQHKDRMFRDDPDSPLPPEQRARFAGLRYFPPNPQLQRSCRSEWPTVRRWRSRL
jgi:uncharacterized protein (DUF1684 family)